MFYHLCNKQTKTRVVMQGHDIPRVGDIISCRDQDYRVGQVEIVYQQGEHFNPDVLVTTSHNAMVFVVPIRKEIVTRYYDQINEYTEVSSKEFGKEQHMGPSQSLRG